MGSTGAGSRLSISAGKHDIYYKKGLLRYSVEEGKDGVYMLYIHGIEVPAEKREQGIGSKLLNKMIQLSNKRGLPIELFAMPIKDSTMDIDRLIEWYEKRGFVHIGGNLMRYTPRS